jgi:hypothetical protein
MGSDFPGGAEAEMLVFPRCDGEAVPVTTGSDGGL